MKKRATASNPSPSENRQGETRRPIERIFAIHQSVRRDRYPNCRTLAAEIGVTPKTIQRDITFMQKDLGLPLAYLRASLGGKPLNASRAPRSTRKGRTASKRRAVLGRFSSA